jgi:proteasome lid subunit RPN8/RPN11
MKIAPDLLAQIVEHARRDAPNECCGIVLARDGAAYAVHELVNRRPSPMSFEVDPLEIYRLSQDGEDLGAIYHSHTRSDPVPSQTDINFGVNWPGVEWIIVGLKNGSVDVRSWLIDATDVSEVQIDDG